MRSPNKNNSRKSLAASVRVRGDILNLIWFAVGLFPFVGSTAERTNTAPIAVVADFDQGRVKYKVDSEPVRSEEILQILGRSLETRGREIPVVVLIDQKNSLETLSNTRGILNKVGFLNIRYFYFSQDTRMMAEINLNHAAMPMSTNPKPHAP